MYFFPDTKFSDESRLTYEEFSKTRFIFYYALIGFVSSLLLFLFFYFFNDESLYNFFMFACAAVNPILGLTAYFAFKKKPQPASSLAIITLALGSFGGLILDFSAYLALMMVLIFSSIFISIGRKSIVICFSLLISSMLLKLLTEIEAIEFWSIPKSNLNPLTLITISILMFSIFSYALFIKFLIIKGMQNTNQLVITSEKLKDTLAMKDRFVSLLAHDLKGPIGSITNFLHGIQSGHIPVTDEVFDLLKDTSSKTQSLLSNLLEWSVKQNTKSLINKEVFLLSEAIRQEVDLLSASAKSKNISIQFVSKGDVLVNADFGMICTVIRNLISNAIKFSNKSGLIMIDCESVDKMIKVSVIDHGVGITPEIQAKLFQQIHFNDSQFGTEQEKGTGLGLIIAYDFVRANGGELNVKSNIGEGSEFWFTIPEGVAETQFEKVSN